MAHPGSGALDVSLFAGKQQLGVGGRLSPCRKQQDSRLDGFWIGFSKSPLICKTILLLNVKSV